ncbi:MAG: hypothetical protein AB8B85_20045 [Paracoccaceae bacterium]
MLSDDGDKLAHFRVETFCTIVPGLEGTAEFLGVSGKHVSGVQQ